MVGFIDARVTLKNVERALQTDERGEAIASVLAEVTKMDRYMQSLLNEYEARYKEISLMQSVFEARLKKALELPPRSYSKARMPENEPWNQIVSLERMKDFLLPLEGGQVYDFQTSRSSEELAALPARPSSRYAVEFLKSLDDASRQLRTALGELLSR